MYATALAPWRRQFPADATTEATGATPSQSLHSSGSSLHSALHAMRARPRLHPPASLPRWGDRLAWCLTQPARPRSLKPLVFPCMPGAGKLGLSYGATLLARGIEEKEKTTWLAGACVMAAGVGIVLWGVVALGNAVGHVYPRGGPWFKAAALGGGVVMGVGYGLSGYAMVRPDVTWASGTSIALKWLGTAMTAFTLPTFVVHGVAVLGDLPFHRRRGAVAAGLMLAGIPTLVASPTLVAQPWLPVAGSQAVVVLASFACLLAAGIYACALPSYPFQPQAHRDSPYRFWHHGGTTAASCVIAGVGSTVASSSLRSSGHVSAEQAQVAAGVAGAACVLAVAIYVRALPPLPTFHSPLPLALEAAPDSPVLNSATETLPVLDSLELADMDHDKL